MAALLAYGSLMHPDEVARHPVRPTGATAVRVHAYRRGFHQEPAWREGEGEERGVLTVRPSPRDWLNAVLLSGIDEAALAVLDQRERGYVRVRVPPEQLEAYAGERLPAEAEEGVHVYTGRAARYDESLLPNADYLALCTAAAAQWGERFLSDFLETTFVGAGVPLREHVRAAPHPS